MKAKQCTICSCDFMPTNGRQMACSDACKRKLSASRHAGYKEKGIVNGKEPEFKREDFPEFYALMGPTRYGKRVKHRCLKCGVVGSMFGGARICYPCSVKNAVYGVMAG